MFLIKFFKQSFQFPTLLKNTNQKIWKIIIYFILLILIANFPASFQVVKEQGSRLDFLVEDFSKETPVNWNLPDDISIKGGKLLTNGNTTEYINNFKDKTYVINKQSKVDDPNNYKNHVLLFTDSVVYIDKDGNVLEGFNYKGFDMDEYSFKALKLAHGDELTNLFNSFANSIEKSFSSHIVLFTLIRNNIVQLLINVIYVLILAGLVMLFKFAFQDFLNYRQSVTFVVLSLGLPAVITFGIGLLSVAFAPVVFQLVSGMVVMIVMLVFAKKTFV